jgi:transcriptional regulator with XRE-family HTH domain
MKNICLANQVKALRVAKGYSQDYLAMQCKLSLRTIQRIESGQTEPHGDTLKRLAVCLEVSIADLVNDPNLSTDDAELPAADKYYIAFVNLSSLSFILFPLLGVIVPFVLWVIKRNTIEGIEEATKRVLNFQITWCLILGICYATFWSSVFFHFNMPASPESLILFIILLYWYNVLVTVINTILTFNSKRNLYYPALRLLR